MRQTSLAVANAQSPPGECFVFGTGDNGQLGMGEDVVELARPRLLDTIPGVNAASVIKICCGGMHTLAVCQGGLMYSWGVNDEGALGRVTRKGAADEESKPGLVTLPSNAGGVVDVSTGDSHVAVVTSTGACAQWVSSAVSVPSASTFMMAAYAASTEKLATLAIEEKPRSFRTSESE